MSRRRQYVFNEVAALYDEVRPGYPPAIVDAAVALAGLPSGGRILEIGCGTGQITVPFAMRGYAILALEPGNALAALAARKCRAYPQVEVLESTFEAWPADGQAFDMVLSAQAFHWIAPDGGCAKAASVLRSGGAIALIWHLDVSQDTPFWQATQPIYDAYFHPPEIDTRVLTLAERAGVYAEAVRACGAFGPVQEVRHAWEATYGGSDYLKLLETYSDHRTLPEPDKTLFFRALAGVIERFGGVVPRRYETLLLLARRT
jgi:ubiquinone/menaquinone biosynthesis C-methylase UbiE